MVASASIFRLGNVRLGFAAGGSGQMFYSTEFEGADAAQSTVSTAQDEAFPGHTWVHVTVVHSTPSRPSELSDTSIVDLRSTATIAWDGVVKASGHVHPYRAEAQGVVGAHAQDGVVDDFFVGELSDLFW